MKEFSQGPEESEDPGQALLFYWRCPGRAAGRSLPEAKERALDRELWEREITHSQELRPARNVLGKLSQIMTGE